MESLLRTRVDRFELSESLKLAEIERLRDEGTLAGHVVPVDGIFQDLPVVATLPEFDKLVHNGNWFLAEQAVTAGQKETIPATVPRARVYDSEGQFIGVYQYSEEKQRYQPQKIFLGGN